MVFFFWKPLRPAVPPESGLWVTQGGNPVVAVQEFECDQAIMRRIFRLIQVISPAEHKEAPHLHVVSRSEFLPHIGRQRGFPRPQ